MKATPILLLIIAGLAAYIYWIQPKETPQQKFEEITYVPAKFLNKLEDESVLKALENPRENKTELNKVIYDFNMIMLNHVANRMNLKGDAKGLIAKEYNKHHDYLSNLYYTDLVEMHDSSDNRISTWYENKITNVVDILNEVSSKYACFLVNHVIKSVLTQTGGDISSINKEVLKTPCAIILTEALKPMMDRLKEKASIRDLRSAEDMLENRVETVIIELGTMKMEDKKAINKKLQTKIWGMTVSSTDLEISAISIIKAGFRLDKYFYLKVDEENRTIIVNLPEAEILSHEVYPKVETLDIGWYRELENKDFNRNFNVLRAEFKQEAYDNGIFTKAQDQAIKVMDLFIQPLVQTLAPDYKVEVRFGYTAKD